MTLRHMTILFCWLLLAVPVRLSAQADCDVTQGTVERHSYASRLLGQQMYYSVYTPACYDPAQEYPVIYLMHGSNEDDGQWQRLGLPDLLDAEIRSGRGQPVIVVMPFGNVIANRNRFDDLSWYRIFLDELLPHAEDQYSITVDPQRRAIGGISRGGFWAYVIGLRHPELFRHIGGHSAFFDRYHAPPEFNPLDLALQAPGIEAGRYWLDRGADDFAAPGLDLMAAALEERGLDVTYEVHPVGQHANAYWSQHVRDYLGFYLRGIASPAEDAPAPPTPAPPSGFATNTPAAAPADAGEPTRTVSPTPAAGSASLDLYVPAAAFASLQTSITRAELQAVRTGEWDGRLVLTARVAQALREQGVPLHEDTAEVADLSQLQDRLWRERRQYTLLPIVMLTLRLRPLWVDDVPVLDQLTDYPFAFARVGGRFDPDRLTRFTLSGVTALARNTRRALDEQGVARATEGIASYVTAVDFFHTSNEVSFHGACPAAIDGMLGGSTSFCSRPEHFELLERLDLDIVELSGNHNNDYGYQAYRDTLMFYRDRGMRVVGGGETLAQARAPLIIDHAGNTVAMLTCNAVGPYYALVNEDPTLLGGVRPGAASCDWNWLESELPSLSAEADVVIVTVQHREFEEYVPTAQQQQDFRRLAALGADVVIGTAPHKPQTMEFYRTPDGRSAFLHYGLGNLFFDQPFWGNSRFFMDTLLIYEGQLLTISLFPGIIEEAVRPRLMTPEERENFLFFMFVQQNGW